MEKRIFVMMFLFSTTTAAPAHPVRDTITYFHDILKLVKQTDHPTWSLREFNYALFDLSCQLHHASLLDPVSISVLHNIGLTDNKGAPSDLIKKNVL